MGNEVWSIVTMVATLEEAETMGESAVVEEMAACSQIEGPVTSIYSWQGKLQREPEMRIVFKTSGEKARRLMSWIRARHSYEIPEILAWPTGLSDPNYSDWVNKA